MNKQEDFEISAILTILAGLAALATCIGAIIIYHLISAFAPHQLYQFTGTAGTIVLLFLGFLFMLVLGSVFCVIWALWPRSDPDML